MMDHEIAEFGRRIGLANLELSPQGKAQLDISGIGSFFLETAEAEQKRWLLMYLCLPGELGDALRIKKLLAQCDFRRNLPFPLAFGVFHRKAILLSRAEERQVTASRIDNTLRFLAECAHAS